MAKTSTKQLTKKENRTDMWYQVGKTLLLAVKKGEWKLWLGMTKWKNSKVLGGNERSQNWNWTVNMEFKK